MATCGKRNGHDQSAVRSWHCRLNTFSGAQPRLKSLGPNTGRLLPTKDWAGCWTREGGSLWGSEVSPPENFLKTQILNPAFWWLLAVKFVAFWKLRPKSWGRTNTLLVPQPKSWGTSLPGPYGCCAYVRSVIEPDLFDNNVPFDNTTPIYLINLLWKLGLGLGLDLQLHYFRIFRWEQRKRASYLPRMGARPPSDI